VKRRIIAYLSLTLVLSMVVLVLLSWLLSATIGEGVHSLLSSEGIRFFFGSFVSVVSHPLLAWIILLSMAWGCLKSCGLLQAFGKSIGYRQRQAFFMSAAFLVLYVGVVLMLTATPHAVLLSATGHLWPSAFSRALVPIVAFGVIMLSVIYGITSRRFLSLADICQTLTDGIAAAAPLLLLYILSIQLFGALRFVFEF